MHTNGLIRSIPFQCLMLPNIGIFSKIAKTIFPNHFSHPFHMLCTIGMKRWSEHFIWKKMRTFLLKISLLISSVHHSSSFSIVSSNSMFKCSFCHWNLPMKCFSLSNIIMNPCYPVFYIFSSCSLHQDHLKKFFLWAICSHKVLFHFKNSIGSNYNNNNNKKAPQ